MAETLIERIKRHEGFTPIPKPDAKGMDVVGYGHDVAPEEAGQFAGGISEETAGHILQSDVAATRRRVESLLGWFGQLDQVRQDVLVELAFQVGAGGLLDFHDMLFRLRSGDYAGAASALLDSQLHRQTPSRCEELAALLLEG